MLATAAMREICGFAVETFDRRKQQRRSGLRTEALQDIARNWRALPPPLYLDVKLDKRSLHIADVRMTVAAITRQSWSITDPALFMMFTALDFDQKRAAWDSSAVLSLIIHALGRRFERYQDDLSDGAITRDLTYLVPALAWLLKYPPGQTFNVPALRGSWCGDVTELVTPGDPPKLVPHIRTFLEG